MKPVSTSIPANSVLFINKLRVLGAFSIVIAHTAGGTADSQTPLSGPWWLCVAIYFFVGFWAIPTFVMISGALLLGSKRQESAWTFYKRRVYRLAVPMLFWTAFYLGLRVWRDHEALGLQQIITSILSGRPYAHLWYLYMIPGLYLVTPALRRFIQATSRTQRIAVIICLMVAADAYHLANVTFWGNPSSVFFMFIPFISYYLLGYELFFHRPRLNTAVLIGAVLLTLGYLAVLARPFLALKGQQFDTFFLGFFGPPVALTAILVFGISARRDRDEANMTWLDRFFARLSPTTLGIYVIHIVLLEILGDVAGDSSEDASLALGLIAGPIIAFSLSGAITALLQKIPYLRRTVG
jgi:surface polysaccharide O-acyltransferase-like enzyme